MSNGEQYFLGELEQEVKTRRELHPDFSQCGMGADVAESNHKGTTLLLKAELIRQRREVEKSNKGFVINGVKYSGAGTGLLGLVYVIGKIHQWW